jgi:hypothetical protein
MVIDQRALDELSNPATLFVPAKSKTSAPCTPPTAAEQRESLRRILKKSGRCILVKNLDALKNILHDIDHWHEKPLPPSQNNPSNPSHAS